MPTDWNGKAPYRHPLAGQRRERKIVHMTPDYILNIIERSASGDAFVGGRCFACGGEPTTGHGEHVIPRWLQRRFELFNERLTLLNGSLLPYRKLTVPCCEQCNNGFLRDIENQVIVALSSPDFSEPATGLIFARWLCKILIGILVKETSLPLDQKAPGAGKIVPSDFLEEFTHAQFILQSARKRTVFHSLHGRFPFTLYLYSIAQDPDFGDFDLSTHVGGQSIAIRMKNLGAIFVNDGGLQLVAGAKGPFGLGGLELHPIQFSEIAARVHYKAALRDASHAYTSWETPEELSIQQLSVRPYTGITVENGAKRIFRPWDDIACAGFIEKYRPRGLPPVYNPATGIFTTTLVDERGCLIPPRTIFSSGARP